MTLRQSIRRNLLAAMAAGMVMLSLPVLPVRAEEDTTPPTINSFSVDPETVDVTTAPQVVQVEVHTSDDLSGVNSVSVGFEPPRGSGYGVTWVSQGPETWIGAVEIPRYVANGTWEISLTVYDKVGNSLSMRGQELVDQGFPGFLTVTSDEDTESPQVQSLSISPDAVDVRESTQLVDVRMQATDDRSGIINAFLTFTPPHPGNPELSTALSLDTDPEGDQDWIGVINVPQYITQGDWSARLVVIDAVGNARTMETGAMAAAGFDHLLNVISNEDTEAPVLEAVTFTPDAVDVSSSGQTVTARVKTHDNLSGILIVDVYLSSPSGNTSDITTTFSLDTNAEEEGIWVGTFQFPQYIENGEWMAHLRIADNVGNRNSMNPAELAEAGFPNKVTVTNNPSQFAASAVGLPGLSLPLQP
jgi:hypothetical protein